MPNEYSGLCIEYVHKASPLDIYELEIVKSSRDGWKQLKPFVDMLKALVPASNRSYNPQNHLWTVDNSGWNQLRTVMDALKIKYQAKWIPDLSSSTNIPKIDVENFFYNRIAPQVQETKESISEKLVKLLDLNTVQDLADPTLVKRLYRKKALELHPDRNNGDGSKMSELNSVWSAYNA